MHAGIVALAARSRISSTSCPGTSTSCSSTVGRNLAPQLQRNRAIWRAPRWKVSPGQSNRSWVAWSLPSESDRRRPGTLRWLVHAPDRAHGLASPLLTYGGGAALVPWCQVHEEL